MTQNGRITATMHTLKSLRFRMLLPGVIISVFVITLLNALFSGTYIRTILQQEQEVNTVGFEAVSRSMTPLIETGIHDVQSIMLHDSVTSYTRLQYPSVAELVHARIRCRDYLRLEIARREGIYGLLFMRKDGSLFGVLPKANLFRDTPEDNPLPEDMKKLILNVPLGRTVWVGPVSGADLCGFENSEMPESIMIAAWKSVHVSYGECYALMLMDESIFENLFASLEDGKSTWHLFTENRTEIIHTGRDGYEDPEKLISESNSGNIFLNEDGLRVCSFSMTMDSPAWTIVREVSMEDYDRVVSEVIRTTAILGGVLLLIALALYGLWTKRFMRQFRSLLKGIVRMGQGDLESTEFVPTSIDEFRQMQGEINRTRLALGQQMDTIRRMEREQAELENERKEQDRIARELSLAREIQASALPRNFPAFPDRPEFDLFASMTPAKEVGGDFYDFFLIDGSRAALVIADVSGKGIPAALFMMLSKAMIRNELLAGYDPAAAMERVNLQLAEHNSSAMFVTAWLAVVDLSTGRGMACNAGHEHPVLRHSGGPYEMIRYKHNTFAGVVKKAKYTNREFELRPGDSLFVYTDGITEARNPEGRMFGEDRLAEALNRNPAADPEELLAQVRKAVDEFVKDAHQFDDFTMLAFRYNGFAPGGGL